MNRFRFNLSSGTVYEWSGEKEGYVFCGNLMGRSEKQFVLDYDSEDYTK